MSEGGEDSKFAKFADKTVNFTKKLPKVPKKMQILPTKCEIFQVFPRFADKFLCLRVGGGVTDQILGDNFSQRKIITPTLPDAENTIGPSWIMILGLAQSTFWFQVFQVFLGFIYKISFFLMFSILVILNPFNGMVADIELEQIYL